MLIAIEKKIAFLAMTKAASTSIETALFPYCDMAYYGNSRIKHISCRRFNRFVRPYLDSLGYGDIETTCLIREPVSWLHSWYRYRARPALNGKARSTAGLDFEEFATLYMAGHPLTRGIGRPSKFVADKTGKPAIDHLFKYENLPAFRAFMENRLQEPLEFAHMNVSPGQELHLSAATRSRLTDFFAPEYALYESAR